MAILKSKPFSHSDKYKDFNDFKNNGAGAVIWKDNTIVSSASSFISLGNEIELDFSTADDFRRKGLAKHCVTKMLTDCEKRRLLVHWDTMAEILKNIAFSFGFELNQEYTVYIY